MIDIKPLAHKMNYISSEFCNSRSTFTEYWIELIKDIENVAKSGIRVYYVDIIDFDTNKKFYKDLEKELRREEFLYEYTDYVGKIFRKVPTQMKIKW